jgi:hypothetical protein
VVVDMKSRDAEIYYERFYTFYFESDTECEWVFLRLTAQSFKTDLAVFKMLLIMPIKVII